MSLLNNRIIIGSESQYCEVKREKSSLLIFNLFSENTSIDVNLSQN